MTHKTDEQIASDIDCMADEFMLKSDAFRDFAKWWPRMNSKQQKVVKAAVRRAEGAVEAVRLAWIEILAEFDP